MKNIAMRIALAACACALGAATLSGCMGATQAASEEEQAQAANRQYMSQVNQIMMDVDGALEDFSAAVQADDLVAMRSAFSEAGKSIDSLEALEAPEALAELQTGYAEGCAQLETALSGYVQLYTDIENAGGSIDEGAYASRLAEIQSAYDDGVSKLEAADQTAANMK